MSSHVEWTQASAEVGYAIPGEEMPDGQTVEPDQWALVIGDDSSYLVVEGSTEELVTFAQRVQEMAMACRRADLGNTGPGGTDTSGEDPGDSPRRHGGSKTMDNLTRGLRCSIYRPAHGDCSNGGLSSRVNEVTLVGEGIPQIFVATESAPDVELGSILGALHARPVEGWRSGQVGPMFGGCFIYSSDSRFPSQAPIALHDRYESPELAAAMHD